MHRDPEQGVVYNVKPPRWESSCCQSDSVIDVAGADMDIGPLLLSLLLQAYSTNIWGASEWRGHSDVCACAQGGGKGGRSQ